MLCTVNAFEDLVAVKEVKKFELTRRIIDSNYNNVPHKYNTPKTTLEPLKPLFS